MQARVFGLHHVELKPGVSEADFEQAVAKMAQWRSGVVTGSRLSLLKADRGANVGKYLLMAEFESVAARNRFYPTENQRSAEAEELLRDEPDFIGPYIASTRLLGDYIDVHA